MSLNLSDRAYLILRSGLAKAGNIVKKIRNRLTTLRIMFSPRPLLFEFLLPPKAYLISFLIQSCPVSIAVG
jgi:hypothetical protein